MIRRPFAMFASSREMTHLSVVLNASCRRLCTISRNRLGKNESVTGWRASEYCATNECRAQKCHVKERRIPAYVHSRWQKRNQEDDVLLVAYRKQHSHNSSRNLCRELARASLHSSNSARVVLLASQPAICLNDPDILPDFVQSCHNLYIYSAAAVVRAIDMLDTADSNHSCLGWQEIRTVDL